MLRFNHYDLAFPAGERDMGLGVMLIYTFDFTSGPLWDQNLLIHL